MKTPTVDDSKPKRDKLGPTGPANIADDEPKKARRRSPKYTATSRTSRYSGPQTRADAARLILRGSHPLSRLETGSLFLIQAVDQPDPAGWQWLVDDAFKLSAGGAKATHARAGCSMDRRGMNDGRRAPSVALFHYRSTTTKDCQQADGRKLSAGRGSAYRGTLW